MLSTEFSNMVRLKHLPYCINAIVILALLFFTLSSSYRSNKTSTIFISANPTTSTDSHQLKLNCTPGEKRLFKYDSFTKFWGNSSQTVNLNADIAVYCMEVNGNKSTLKYFVEIVKLVPNILKKAHETISVTSVSRLRPVSALSSRSGDQMALTNAKFRHSPSVDRMYLDSDDEENNVKVEPILEEIGEMSTKVKRSVSGWFSNTWVTVKDFFGKIFNSAEVSQGVSVTSKSHPDDFKTSILGQCKSGTSGHSGDKGDLPFDESIFDDLAPTFKIGANREYGAAASASEIDNNVHEDNVNKENNEMNSLSFFDRPTIIRHGRHRRDVGKQQQQSNNNNNNGSSPAELFKLPFEFVQTNDGTIVDVRFSDKETDLSIKNFKRHICDLFATHLDRSKPSQIELTPVGKHVTKYFYDDGDGKVLQATLNKLASGNGDQHKNNGEDTNNNGDTGPLLTRVLAVIGVDRNGQLAPNDEQPYNDPLASSLDNHHHHHSDDKPIRRVAIIRDINSTDSIRFGSQAMVHDMSQFRIKVKQIQQISANQMISTAGQLSMSLVKAKNQLEEEELIANNRYKRSSSSSSPLRPDISIGIGLNDNDLDVANLLHVSTSFSMKLSNQQQQDSTNDKDEKQRNRRDTSTSDQIAIIKSKTQSMSNLEEIKKLESQLKMVSTSVLAESASQDAQLQRLDILRDQVALRLNEEAMINKDDKSKGYDSGLGLTKIILDHGRTSKTRGSLYSTLEEIIDLEYSTKQENQPESISRLLRETIKSSQLKSYCQKSLQEGLHLLEESKVKSKINDNNDNQWMEKTTEKRLGDCKKILQLLLRANGQEAIELTLNLIDECNRQLTTNLRHEEIGYGPGVRYYRRWRQQFIELLSDISRPKESLLDKLMLRLHYNFAHANNSSSSTRATRRSSGNGRSVAINHNGVEYTMHNPSAAKSFNNNNSNNRHATTNNDSITLTDDTNNNDSDGSIVMTITNLATKPSISQEKRVDIGVKLLNVLRNTTCSLYDGPDLDILESIGNLQTIVPEIVPKIVHLAKKCRHQDQYTVACVHASQGQLQSGLIQRWLMDLIKAPNVTCLVKSEIVATLITVSSVQELTSFVSKQQQQQATNKESVWPHYGLNQVDNTLLDLVVGAKSSPVARKCLRKHVEHYMRSKHSSVSKSDELVKRLSDNQSSSDTINQRTNRNVPTNNRAVWSRSHLLNTPFSSDTHTHIMSNEHKRYKRYVTKDFWDEASCKRWSYDQSDNSASPNNLSPNEDGWLASNDEDNSIYTSLAAVNKTSAAARRKNGLLLEREDSPESPLSSGGLSGSNTVSRRQKCTGTRTYGPRNAEATIKAEIVNDIVGPKDDNKFLARFTVGANFLGSKVDIGRMYLWHQRQTTRAYVNMFGKTLWDTSHSCHDKTPRHLLYMPLFDFNIWVVKINVGIRLHSEMGFYSSCRQLEQLKKNNDALQNDNNDTGESVTGGIRDELHLFPNIGIRASGEASAKFVVARAGMSIGSHYSYQGQIRISRKPESCMSIASGHEPMNVTFSSWYQLWNNDCQYWGSRTKGEPYAVKWSINKRRSTTWVSNECLGSASNNRSLSAKIEP